MVFAQIVAERVDENPEQNFEEYELASLEALIQSELRDLPILPIYERNK